jgi:uridine phosphorylase
MKNSSNHKKIISPSDVEREAISDGTDKNELTIPQIAILTFCGSIVDELKKRCSLKNWEWKGGRYSPYYGSYKGWKGKIKNNVEICIFIPPMGASSIAAFSEDCIHFGARIIFLLCGSWSLGEDYLAKGQIHLPQFAIGMDGTSYHYGNTEYRIDAEQGAYNALLSSLKNCNCNWKTGGVGSFEAIYQISKPIIDNFRKDGCISMENGEAASLFAVAKKTGITLGILLQPYIDLEKGWKIDYMDEVYKKTCASQAKVALNAITHLTH